MTKYIFVTGGVVSGLGKGITAASLGRLLKARGVKDVKRQVSERLGHHREDVPRSYLDYETKEE